MLCAVGGFVCYRASESEMKRMRDVARMHQRKESPLAFTQRTAQKQLEIAFVHASLMLVSRRKARMAGCAGA